LKRQGVEIGKREGSLMAVVSRLLEKSYRATCTGVNTSTLFDGVVNVVREVA